MIHSASVFLYRFFTIKSRCRQRMVVLLVFWLQSVCVRAMDGAVGTCASLQAHVLSLMICTASAVIAPLSRAYLVSI